MSKKIMFTEATPLLLALYARSAITAEERKQILGSLRGDPANK